MAHTPDTTDESGFRDFDLAIIEVAEALRQAEAAHEHLTTKSPYVAAMLIPTTVDQAVLHANKAKNLLGPESALVGAAFSAVERTTQAHTQVTEELRKVRARDALETADEELAQLDTRTQTYVRHLDDLILTLAPCPRCGHDHTAPGHQPLLELDINPSALFDYGEDGVVDHPGLELDLRCRGCRSYVGAQSLLGIRSDHQSLIEILPVLLGRALREIRH